MLSYQRKSDALARSKTTVNSGFHLPPIHSRRVGIPADNFISEDED